MSHWLVCYVTTEQNDLIYVTQYRNVINQSPTQRRYRHTASLLLTLYIYTVSIDHRRRRRHLGVSSQTDRPTIYSRPRTNTRADVLANSIAHTRTVRSASNIRHLLRRSAEVPRFLKIQIGLKTKQQGIAGSVPGGRHPVHDRSSSLERPAVVCNTTPQIPRSRGVCQRATTQ